MSCDQNKEERPERETAMAGSSMSAGFPGRGLASPLGQLTGLGEALCGLGAVILACADEAQKLAEAKPEPEIGKRIKNPDYKRYRDEDANDFVYENRYVKTPEGRPTGCGEDHARVLDWMAFQDDPKRMCSELSGAEIQTFISSQVAAAKAAAASLCTDSDCPKPATALTYQKWWCDGHSLWVELQLELTCVAK
ncbi:MAG: hypothetical protein ACLP2P_17360 [Desulfobaccales bacterium]